MTRVVFTKYQQSLSGFFVFKWGRIFESAIGKWEVKSNLKLRTNYFSVNVSLLADIFRRQISKNRLF